MLVDYQGDFVGNSKLKMNFFLKMQAQHNSPKIG
jgi:hypothetical protein